MNSLTVLTFLCAATTVGVIFYMLGASNSSERLPNEKQRLRQEIEMLSLNPANSSPRPEPKIVDKDQEELEALKAKLAAKEAKETELAAQAKIETDVIAIEPIEQQPPAVDPSTDEKLQRHARLVANASLMGSVVEYAPKDGFVVIRSLNSNNVVEGARLSIRRKSGIIGQLEVTRIIDDGQAIADVIPTTFLGGDVDIKTGDELIIAF